MVASGHSVWLDLNNYPNHDTLLRFARQRLIQHLLSAFPLSGGEFGYGQPKYVAGATGIWTVQNQDLIRIDPNTSQASKARASPARTASPRRLF